MILNYQTRGHGCRKLYRIWVAITYIRFSDIKSILMSWEVISILRCFLSSITMFISLHVEIFEKVTQKGILFSMLRWSQLIPWLQAVNLTRNLLDIRYNIIHILIIRFIFKQLMYHCLGTADYICLNGSILCHYRVRTPIDIKCINLRVRNVL